MTDGEQAMLSGEADELCEVIITGPDLDWLVGFTRRLVEDRLAACGQHSVPIRSIYRWQGRIEDESEARVSLHTRRSLFPVIVERANREHPYEVPCVCAIRIVDANPDYRAWVFEGTLRPDSGA